MTWFEYLSMFLTIAISFLTISITSYRFHKESEYLKNKYITDGIKEEKKRVQDKIERLLKTQSDKDLRVALEMVEEYLK